MRRSSPVPVPLPKYRRPPRLVRRLLIAALIGAGVGGSAGLSVVPWIIGLAPEGYDMSPGIRAAAPVLAVSGVFPVISPIFAGVALRRLQVRPASLIAVLSPVLAVVLAWWMISSVEIGGPVTTWVTLSASCGALGYSFVALITATPHR